MPPQSVEYYSGNRKQSVTVQGVLSGRQRSPGDSAPMRFPLRPRVAATR